MRSCHGSHVGFCDVIDLKVTPILLLLANRFETDPIMGTVFSMVSQLESSMGNTTKKTRKHRHHWRFGQFDTSNTVTELRNFGH